MSGSWTFFLWSFSWFITLQRNMKLGNLKIRNPSSILPHPSADVKGTLHTVSPTIKPLAETNLNRTANDGLRVRTLLPRPPQRIVPETCEEQRLCLTSGSLWTVGRKPCGVIVSTHTPSLYYFAWWLRIPTHFRNFRIHPGPLTE